MLTIHMTIKNALTKYSKLLKENNTPSPNLDAEVILSYVLKKPKEYLYTYPEKNLTTKQLNDLTTLIKRRTKGEPVAYLTNHKEFFGLDFYVDERVLIPRPETEELVEEVIKVVSNKGSVISNQSLTICDIGTGSGCIAIALAKNLPNIKLIATDISKDALTVAKKNARQLKVYDRIKFLHGNLLEPIKNMKLDIIVANLPYLTKQEALKHEPNLALVASNKGLSLYNELFHQIKKYKFPNAVVIIEFAPHQRIGLSKYIKRLYPQGEINIKKDLAKRYRILKITL